MTSIAKTKTIKRLFIAALALVFLAVVPFHHHADGKTHDGDCQICAVTGHVLLPDAAAAAGIVFVLLFLVTFCGIVVSLPQRVVAHLRGPPAF